MLKKLWILIPTVCGLASCVATPKYVLSDEEAYKISYDSTAALNCNPDSQKLVKSLPKTEQQEFAVAFLMEASLATMRNVIGDTNTYWILNDPASKMIASQKFAKSREMVGNLKLAKEQCTTYKSWARDFAEKWKMAKTQQKAEEKARQAFYATPQGQAYLAQQQLAIQQQQMQQQMINQMQMMQEQQQWNQINNNRVQFTNCYGVMNGINCMSY